MPDLKITEHPAGPNKDINVIAVNGSIDAYNSELLSEKLEASLKSGHSRIIVDCTNLTFISSSGMGVFIGCEDDLLDRKGGLKFVGVPEKIANVFKKVGVADLFKMYDSESLAISDFLRGV